MNGQIASNNASSLLSTISSSPAVMTNPYVYSQTANISEFTSTQWIKTESTSGTASNNATLHYDIAKMGLVGRAILDIPYKWTGGASTKAADTVCSNFPLWGVSEIVLSSQGRTLCRLDRTAIIARIAERPSYTKDGIEDAFQLAQTTQTGTDAFASDIEHCYLSLDFPINNDQYAIDTLFVQNCRISVTMGNLNELARLTTADGTSGEHTLTNHIGYDLPSIYIQYKNQNQVSSDALTSANFSSGLLSTILPTMVSESIHHFTTEASGTVNKLSIQLKETSCVENVYVYMMVHPNDHPLTANFSSKVGVPLRIDGTIKFSSNGQAWFDLPADLIGYFGHESQDGRNAYSAVHKQTVNTSTALPYVYCLNMAQGGLVDNHVSGLLSMRELSNPTIELEFPSLTADGTAAVKMSVHVCYATRQLSTVVSSSGQISISLSN